MLLVASRSPSEGSRRMGSDTPFLLKRCIMQCCYMHALLFCKWVHILLLLSSTIYLLSRSVDFDHKQKRKWTRYWIDICQPLIFVYKNNIRGRIKGRVIMITELFTGLKNTVFRSQALEINWIFQCCFITKITLHAFLRLSALQREFT